MTDLHARVRLIRSALLVSYRAVTGSWLAALVVVMAGGVMMAAGYLLRTVGLGAASLATIPGGVLIIVAFRLVRPRRPTTRRGTSGTPVVSGLRTTTRLLRNMGLPDDLPHSSRFVMLTLTATSGAVMVLAGYTWAAQNWKSAAALAVIGGLLISGALIVAMFGRKWNATQRGR